LLNKNLIKINKMVNYKTRINKSLITNVKNIILPKNFRIHRNNHLIKMNFFRTKMKINKFNFFEKIY